LSDVQKLAIALARLSRFPKSSNTRQNDPSFISPVAQRVSFATVFQAYEINGLRVANVRRKIDA